MQIDVRYARVTAQLPLPTGVPHLVRLGEHYPADDPVVRAHPDAFSADPRFGMRWTGEPPTYMADPPDEDTAPARAPRSGRRDS